MNDVSFFNSSVIFLSASAGRIARITERPVY